MTLLETVRNMKIGEGELDNAASKTGDCPVFCLATRSGRPSMPPARNTRPNATRDVIRSRHAAVQITHPMAFWNWAFTILGNYCFVL